MKQALLAAVLAAVAASALTILLSPPPRAETAGPSSAEFRAILAEFSAELRALRKEPPAPAAAAAIPVLAPGGDPAAVAPVAGAPAPAAASAPAPETPAFEAIPADQGWAVEPAAPREERSAIARSPEIVEKLHGITGWAENADVRRVWILSGEEQVVGSFGKPDEIILGEGGSESWIYRTRTGQTTEDGEPEWRDVVLQMNRGRLVFAYD